MTLNKGKINTKGLRTCIACRTKGKKSDFVTFKSKEGTLVLDIKRNIAGKGMNLCKNVECFDMAVKKGSFRRIQKIKEIPKELRDEFLQVINN